MKHLIFLTFFTFFAHIHASDEHKKSKSKPNSPTAASVAPGTEQEHPLRKFFLTEESWKAAEIASITTIRSAKPDQEVFVSHELRLKTMEQNPDVDLTELNAAITACFTKKSRSPHFGEELMKRRQNTLHGRSKSTIYDVVKN